DIVPVATANARVAVEIVVSVDGDVVVTAPAATPSPAATPERPHHHTNTERDCHSGGVIPWRWVVNRGVGIDRWTVHHHWIIRRDIHHLRIGLFDHDHLLAFDDFGFHFLLLVGFQIAFVLGLLAHALHRIHQVALLCQKCIA